VGPENEQAFVRAYWTEKMATEKAIRDQLSPLRKKLEDEARQRLERNFKSNVK
jgi:DNA-binding winged helix-turn-helix (wHTH) protein